MLTSSVRTALLSLVFMLAASTTRAGLIVDQQFLPPDPPAAFGVNLDNSVFPTSFIGETFRPTFSAVDAISFFLSDANQSNGLGGSFYVELLSGDLTTLLATSGTESLPDSFGGGDAGDEVLFRFGTRVALVPDDTYAAVLRKASGDRFFVRGVPTDGYARGQYIPAAGSDLFFREGLLSEVPEPCGIALFATGVASIGGLRGLRRRR